jgi:hypothetical protein
MIRLISTKNLLVGLDGTAPTTPPVGATAASHGVTTDGAFITAQFLAGTTASQVLRKPEDFALVVINPDGQHAWIDDISQALLSAGEKLTPRGAIAGGAADVPTPTVTSASARTLHDGAGWKVTVKGTNFEPDCTCTMDATGGTPLTPVNVTSTHFEVVITRNQLPTGGTVHQITVTNPAGPTFGSGSLSKPVKLR